MLAAIKHNLANLFNFSGQDRQSTFWWYVLFLVIMWIIAYIVVIAPVVASTVNAAMDAAQSGVDEAAMQTQMEAEVLGQVRYLGFASLALSVVFTLLLAASLVRRAQDAGKPAWWGYAPTVLNLVATAITFYAVNAITAGLSSGSAVDLQAMAETEVPGAMAGDLLGWLAIILAIVIGVLPSARGAEADTESFE